MKIHREGRLIIPITLIVLSGLWTGFWFLSLPVWALATLGAAGLITFFLILWFFRVPSRAPVEGDEIVTAPADGKVVVIEKVFVKEHLNEERIQISIFMSPLNVHIQWYPIDGDVSYYQYHPGKYLVAWHPKSSELNERATIAVKGKQEIMFRQIAGAMARRIITYARTGKTVKKSDQAGFIRFGSRVDIFLPLDAEINVNIGDKVSGLETVLAKLSS